MKNINTNTNFNASIRVAFYISSLITLFMCCSKESDPVSEYVPEERTIKVVDGLVVNYLDNTPVEGVEVVLVTKYGLFDDGESKSVYTNNKGEFHFSGDSGHLKLWDHNFWNNYQRNNVWANGEKLDPVTNALGVETEFNSETPFEITFGVYPTTRFNVHLTNTLPANETDTLNIQFENASNFHLADNPGILTDHIIDGVLIDENILTIYYKITSNGTTESIKRTVECGPGEVTDVFIEY